MASKLTPLRELNAFKVESIRADLESAIVFAKLALQADERREVNRHRRNACEAYEEALHSLKTATLTRIELESIRTKLAHLESILMESDSPNSSTSSLIV
jgi:hypothetical protein